MRFWRICRALHASETATGEGARLFGGRWNSRGIRVVYASTSLALAAVETFVHLEPNLQPADLVYVEGEIPKDLPVERLDFRALPPDWFHTRDESLRRFGDEWVRSARTVTLLVPSAAIRGNWNILLNPGHESFAGLRFQPPQPFAFDIRMFR